MAWITDLAKLYSHSNVSEIQMDKLANRFKGKGEGVMAAAIDLYIEENEYFPSIARFRPYVETAEHMAMAKAPRRSAFRYTDDEMFDIEVARGTMRPIEEIDAERQSAKLQLQKMRKKLEERYPALVWEGGNQ